MKKDKQDHIVLTKRESERITDLLYTLAAMSGAYDEDFTKDCQEAEKLADKMQELLLDI